MTHDEFRKLLDELGKAETETWAAKLESLREEYPHTIHVVDPKPSDFNCFAYALGIHEDPFFQEVRRRFQFEVFADSEFVERLLRNGVLVSLPAPSDCVVIYRNDGALKHAGVHSGGRVLSKWADSGLLLEHGILEVGLGYGSEITLFERPDPEKIGRAFEALFAERRPGYYEPMKRAAAKRSS